MIRRFSELTQAGLDPLLAGILDQNPGGEMTPLQQRAAQSSLLRGGDVLVQAPTASGKTLVAEMAALMQLGRGRRVLYLAPTRALAAEKAREFKERYGPKGLRVAWTSGDRRRDDRDILAGRIHMTVAVVEKALGMALRRPGWLRSLGLVAVDEVQLLGDPQRGGSLDVLLSLWRGLPEDARPQLVALSAVLERPHALADWLGAELIESRERRTPLHEGVLDVHSGVFRFREAGREGAPQEEALLPPTTAGAEPSPSEVALRLAERHGPTLVFCGTRDAAWRLAEEAALTKPFPAAAAQAATVREARVGMMGERLAGLLEAGIAVHTADLTGPLRAAVEEAFAWDQARLLFATPTLDQGVNLSASVVVHAAEVPDDGPGRGRMLLPKARFVNQGGRAGRNADAVGRSMLVARGEFEAMQLWRGVVDAPAAPLRSPLGARGSLLGVAASLLAAGRAATPAEMIAFAADTFAASADGDGVRAAMERASCAGEAFGFWTRDGDGAFDLTNLGWAVAATGVQPETARSWATMLEGARGRPSTAAAAFLVALAPEWETQPLAVAPWERRRNRWPAGLRERLEASDDLSQRLEEYVSAAGASPFACHRAARRALLLDDWLAGESEAVIEQDHGVPAGQLERLAATAAWLAGAAAEVAGAVGAAEAAVECFESLARELSGRAARLSGDPHPPQPEPETKHERQGNAAPDPDSARLVFPAHDAGEVLFDGRAVSLSPLPYALLRLLAENAGATVSKEAIVSRLWPDAQVQEQMISYHRKALVERLGPGATGLIRTRQRWGLRLVLEPEEVSFEEVGERVA